MTLFPNAMKKLSSVSLVKICRLDVVQAKPPENQRDDLQQFLVSNGRKKLDRLRPTQRPRVLIASIAGLLENAVAKGSPRGASWLYD